MQDIENINEFIELISNDFPMYKDQLHEYASGIRHNFDYPNFISGTGFQKKVWITIFEIEYGKTKSYKEIAKSLNCEKAVRAVANACGKNPLPLVIPCHRVVGSNGKIGGYKYGINLKQQLLKFEQKFLSNQ
ncbi:MAG: methylated-DNA--[protein]-cysteine S-methyltransferase [bacterium]